MNAQTSTLKTWTLTLGLLPILLFGCQKPPKEAQPPSEIPVRSEVLTPGSFRPVLLLLGRVEPAGRFDVVATTSGRLSFPKRFASGLRTGESVRRGELLFELVNEDLALALAEAELSMQAATTERERASQGVEGGFMARAELKRREIDEKLAAERLHNARRQHRRLQVRAEVSGTLWVEETLPPGSEVPAGEHVVQIATEGPPRVEAWAAAADLDTLELGMDAICLRPGGTRIVGQGRIVEMANRVDERGTVRVVIEITDDQRMPPPGDGVEVQVELADQEHLLTVPREALVIDGGATHVFVLEPRGQGYTARRRLVVTGASRDGRVAVIDGLFADERIAVRGAEWLADGLPAVDAGDGEE